MKPMYRLICPQCGKSDGVVEVVYGFPTLEGEQAAQRGEVVLGGCILDEGQPTHYCRDCKIWILKQRGKEARIVSSKF